jgi:hypothetical protein
MFQRNFIKFLLVTFLLAAVGCQQTVFEKETIAPASLRDVPALRLNFRFETDVPAPTINNGAQTEERNAAVQNDFDQNRSLEILDKTITSPNKQQVLVVFHKIEDLQGDFRLDMYSTDGKLLRRITHDGMAVHYPDTIVWSPDSSSVAFMAMGRVSQTNPTPESQPKPTDSNTAANTETNANVEANSNAENTNIALSPTPNVEQPKAVLTFRTEQIYICDSSGGNVQPLTQNEGLIYFYFVWSPDSSKLASLAATFQEWRFLNYQADIKGEVFVPFGRLRMIEKNGRERRLNDNLTAVRPVWSPDSAKIADAFDTQVRIYDAIGDAPTQAAIPLRNQLLIASKTFDEQLQVKESNGNVNTNTNTTINTNQTANAPLNQPIGSLPDASTLVSFNPIINLEWTEDKLLYLQTGYIKNYKEATNNVQSYLRWHRLIFSPQAVTLR